MNILSIIMAITTLLIGLFVGLTIKNSEIEKLSKENNFLKTDKENLLEENRELAKKISANETKLEVLTQLQEIIKKDFTEIANKVIKSEQSDLREQNREALEEKLKPIKEDFENFRKTVEEFNKQGESNTATLKEKIENLVKESRAIETTAMDLTNAIKANSQVRGQFGELILENLLNQAGLVNKRTDKEKGNYITQQTFKDFSAPNERPRPDVVIYLPENKHIIIDSKCPLNNFIGYCNSNDEVEKSEQLKCFYNEVMKMIDDLSGKYNTLEGLHTPEFKLMFLPLESCASYIYSNSNITTYAWSKNIFIVCPSTLFATLKLVNKIWKQQNQDENLNNIIKIASGAYEKFVTFVEKLEKIKTNFNSTANAFESAYKTIDGRGGLREKLRVLEELNLTTSKRLENKTNKLIEIE